MVLLTSSLLLYFYSNRSYAEEDVVTEKDIKTVLDQSPFISVRAMGMAGAISTLADGIHAPYYNPAGIGGIHWGKDRPPMIRQFHFPYIGFGANENAQDLNQEFKDQEGAKDRAVGRAIVDAHNGERQFVRSSALLSFVVSRFMMVSFADLQFAGFRRDRSEIEPGDEQNISAAYRSQYGQGLGWSVTDSKGRFYLGAYSSYVTKEEFIGDFTYDQFVRKGDRKESLNPSINKYQGFASNIGMLWVLGGYGRPAISLVSKNVGSSKFELVNKSGEIQPDRIKIVDPENLTIGFSISPRVGRTGALNLIWEGHHLTEKEMSLNKKFRFAAELTLGGFGSEGIFGLRAGHNFSGPSAGLSLNLGLVQLEAATHTEDIGIGNHRAVEKRNFFVFSTNVLME